ncbi:MAG: hypothetical protein IIA99_05830 [Proteobacteria bacterium]|nr:hypothetical protein [Pseudomonadota bacterium]
MVKTFIFLASALILVSACSDDEQGSSERKLSGDHVWKEQTDTIDKAKEVEGLLQDVAEKQRQAIEAQAQ